MSLSIKKTEFRFILLADTTRPSKTYYAKEDPVNLLGGHYKFEDLRTGKKLTFSVATQFLIEEVNYEDIEFVKWCDKKQIDPVVITVLVSFLRVSIRSTVYLSDVISFFRFSQDVLPGNRDDYRSIIGELFVDGFLETPDDDGRLF